MTDFLQLHFLTFYPPSNLNRDDLGRPKSAIIGGSTRLRISSQALKRAWRTSEKFEKLFTGLKGERTRRIGREIALSLQINHGVSHDIAQKISRVLASVFGKLDTTPKPGQELFIKQLAFISPKEKNNLDAFLSKTLADDSLREALVAAADEVDLDVEDEADGNGNDTEDDKGRKRKKKQSKTTTKLLKAIREEVLTVSDTAVDIGMFGRMLADSPKFNREAAVQVAHAVTTHKTTIEDDYYTAVDDLKKPSEDAGAGFLGEAGFGAGVFYLYACINRDLLRQNLGGDDALAGLACAALVEAAATVSPAGKQASFASRARAEYILAERGTDQPRALTAAFLKPVGEAEPDGMMAASIKELTKLRTALAQAYGDGTGPTAEMNIHTGKGTLEDIKAFCRAGV